MLGPSRGNSKSSLRFGEIWIIFKWIWVVQQVEQRWGRDQTKIRSGIQIFFYFSIKRGRSQKEKLRVGGHNGKNKISFHFSLWFFGELNFFIGPTSIFYPIFSLSHFPFLIKEKKFLSFFPFFHPLFFSPLFSVQLNRR